MPRATTDRPARFERIFASHHGDVARYARRRAVSPDPADDVVSETFLVVWRPLDEVPENALPWLSATARGVVANQHRTARRGARLAERRRRPVARWQGRPGGGGWLGDARPGRPRGLRPRHRPRGRRLRRAAGRGCAGARRLPGDPARSRRPLVRTGPFGLVREGADGGWDALPPMAAVPTQIVGTTGLSVLERPATAGDRLPEQLLGPTRSRFRGTSTPSPGAARRAVTGSR